MDSKGASLSYHMSMNSVPESGSALRAAQVAELVGGELETPCEGLFHRVMDTEHAEASDVVFFRAGGDSVGRPPSTHELEAFASTRAGLALVDDSVREAPCPIVRVTDPALAAAMLSRHFVAEAAPAPGVHPSAVIEDGAEVHAAAHVGPLCVVASGAQVGAGCVLVAQVHVGAGAKVGDGCILHPNVVLYGSTSLGPGCTVHAGTALGTPGFGYVWDGQRHLPVPQVGGVEIGAGVEIGSNSCVDSGTFQPTRIGDGCILDNHVQVGHNAQLGRAVVLCGKVGISGSVTVGDGAVFGGQAATVGHLTVGAGAKIAARAAVMKDVPAGATIAGFPAVDLKQHQREQVKLRRLLRER